MTQLSTSFYQPLSERQFFFVEPRLGYLNRPFDFYVGNVKFAEYRDQGYGGGLDLGANLGEFAEARVGAYFGWRTFALAEGPSLVPTRESGAIGIATASFRIDRLDSVNFTRSGYLLTLDATASRPSLGAIDNYTRFEGQARTAFSWGAHTIRLSLRAGDTPNADDLPVYAQFQLGGFLNMSGYRQQQLLGPRYVYGGAIYQTRLAKLPLLEGIYAGLAYEAARMPQLVTLNDQTVYQSGTVYLAADTPLGAAYLGFGGANSGNRAFYLYLGKSF